MIMSYTRMAMGRGGEVSRTSAAACAAEALREQAGRDAVRPKRAPFWGRATPRLLLRRPPQGAPPPHSGPHRGTAAAQRPAHLLLAAVLRLLRVAVAARLPLLKKPAAKVGPGAQVISQTVVIVRPPALGESETEGKEAEKSGERCGQRGVDTRGRCAAPRGRPLLPSLLSRRPLLPSLLSCRPCLPALLSRPPLLPACLS